MSWKTLEKSGLEPAAPKSPSRSKVLRFISLQALPRWILPTRHVAIDDDCLGKGLAFTKNNWPADWLAWWGFPDSWGFPLVSAALMVYAVHRSSSASIRAAVSSSSKFEQSDGIGHRRLSRRCGVWKLHALPGQLGNRNFYEGDGALRVRCFWSQLAMLPFSSFVFGVLWCFFFWKQCRSNREPSRNSGWVYRNWGPFKDICGAQTAKHGHGGGFRNREPCRTKRFACSPAWSPVSRWSKMILGAPGTKMTNMKTNTWAKMHVTVGFDCVCTVTWVSIQMQKSAKVLKTHSKKTGYVLVRSQGRGLYRALETRA